MSQHQRGLRGNGFTLIEIMFVVMLIGVLLAIAIPTFQQARDKTRKTVCIKNLSHIQTAKEQASIATQKSEGDNLDIDDLVPRYLRKFPECPADGVYDLQPVGDNPSCTIDGHEL